MLVVRGPNLAAFFALEHFVDLELIETLLCRTILQRNARLLLATEPFERSLPSTPESQQYQLKLSKYQLERKAGTCSYRGKIALLVERSAASSHLCVRLQLLRAEENGECL